jgi:iron complex transport system ATP-binding protein
MLSSNKVTFSVGGRALVDNATASFEPGRLHLIVGPNGAGKSTYIKLLARLLRPHSGTIQYDGHDVASWSERQLAHCRAVLSQAVEVAFSIPVRELVMMGRYPHFGARPGAADLHICEEVMKFFEVESMADRSYGTLSGGEKQRVQFARVLAQIWHPINGVVRYLFLDEPLTFLDVHHQIDFMSKVRTIASQQDVVVVGVVHDLSLAARFSDRLLLMHEGRILADGRPGNVLKERHLRTAFQVYPVLLKNPATGEEHVVFESAERGNEARDPGNRDNV